MSGNNTNGAYEAAEAAVDAALEDLDSATDRYRDALAALAALEAQPAASAEQPTASSGS